MKTFIQSLIILDIGITDSALLLRHSVMNWYIQRQISDSMTQHYDLWKIWITKERKEALVSTKHSKDNNPEKGRNKTFSVMQTKGQSYKEELWV